jgi:hypothetical protein
VWVCPKAEVNLCVAAARSLVHSADTVKDQGRGCKVPGVRRLSWAEPTPISLSECMVRPESQFQKRIVGSYPGSN